MYYNANGERISRARWKELYRAFKNRQELIKAGFNRRDLMNMGLLTAGGVRVAVVTGPILAHVRDGPLVGRG